MNAVPFEGIRVIMNHENLPRTAFVHIPAGGVASSEFDVAVLHNLGKGGDYNIETTGSFHYARDESTAIEGSIAYKSNTIDAHIDGRQATSAYNVYHAKRAEKRSKIGSGCTGDKLATAQNALAGCAKRAQGAYEAAVNGSSAKMEEYFKSSTQATRNTVAQAFKKMAAECGTTNSGSTGYSCTDIDNYCEQSGAVAYAEVNVGSTVYCEKYYTDIQPFSTQCHYGDQAGVTIHEMSHLPQIKGTSDYAGYGYDFVRSLSAEQNLNHADTYMLFANAIQVGC
jgi:deuterolysin